MRHIHTTLNQYPVLRLLPIRNACGLHVAPLLCPHAIHRLPLPQPIRRAIQAALKAQSHPCEVVVVLMYLPTDRLWDTCLEQCQLNQRNRDVLRGQRTHAERTGWRECGAPSGSCAPGVGSVRRRQAERGRPTTIAVSSQSRRGYRQGAHTRVSSDDDAVDADCKYGDRAACTGCSWGWLLPPRVEHIKDVVIRHSSELSYTLASSAADFSWTSLYLIAVIGSAYKKRSIIRTHHHRQTPRVARSRRRVFLQFLDGDPRPRESEDRSMESSESGRRKGTVRVS